MKPAIFLSYARSDDKPFVRRLYAHLAEKFNIWWDLKEMPSRALSFLEEIRRAIDACERVVVVIGPGAVGSDYVRAEWLYAMTKDKPVVPLLRAGRNARKPAAKDYELLPAEMKNLHTLDFRTGRPFGEACEQLVRVLRQKVPTPGPVRTAMPDLPPHFQPRPDDLSAIADAVLPDLKNPVVVDGPARVTFIQGMGGAGKSVMAAAFLRLTETRRAFADGVAWISYSESATVRDALATAGSAFGDHPSAYMDDASAASSLHRKIEALRCLIVLDNAALMEHVTPFARALGPNCRLLVTTRDASLAVGRTAVAVNLLGDAAAILHLADWASVAPDQLPPEALEVARLCAGLPLATAVCGAMVSQGTPWADLLSKLEQADLAFLKALFDYPHPTVLQCLKVSLDLLDAPERERYAELRIFEATQPVPEDVVVRLWTRDGKMGAEDARESIKTFALRALLRIETDAGVRRISLHDLYHALLRGLYPEPRPIHALLVTLYRDACGGAWTKLADDGYVFSSIVFHMLVGGAREEALQLVAGSDTWFRFKRGRAAHESGLLKDIELCLRTNPDLLVTASLCAVRELVRYGAAAYADDDLLCLVRLGRPEEALFQTRLRGDPVKAVNGLLTLLEAGFRQAEQETETRIRALAETKDRATALARFACIIATTGRERAQALARETITWVTPFESESATYDMDAAIRALEAMVTAGLTREALGFVAAVAGDWQPYLLRWVALRAVEVSLAGLRSVLTRLRRCASGGAKALALAYVAEALAGADKRQAARLLKEADEAAVSIEDAAAEVRTAARRAVAHARLGSARAAPLFRKAEAGIRGRGVRGFDRSGLLMYLSEALLSAGDFERAKRIAGKMPNQLDRGRFGERHVAELIRRSRMDDATASIAAIESMESRAAAFSSLAAAFASAGRKGDAEQYLRMALDTRQIYDERANTLEALARMVETLHPVEAAIASRLLSQAMASAQSLPGDYDRSSSVLEVVRACCAAGRIADAESLLCHIRNEVHHREGAEEIGAARGRFEPPEIAIQWAEATLQDDSLLWTVARIHVHARRWAEAAASALRIGRDYNRAVNLADVAAAMSLAGAPDAEDVFSQAESVARNATDEWATPEYIRTVALAAVASALLSCGRTEEAWRVAESTEMDRDGAKPRLKAAAALARAHDRRGIDFLAAFWDMCLRNSYRDGMLEVCFVLAQEGLTKDAMTVADKLLADRGLETYQRTAVCGCLAKIGQHALAIQNLELDSVDGFLEELAKIAAGSADCVAILRESVRVAGWVRPDWKRVFALFGAADSSPSPASSTSTLDRYT